METKSSLDYASLFSLPAVTAALLTLDITHPSGTWMVLDCSTTQLGDNPAGHSPGVVRACLPGALSKAGIIGFRYIILAALAPFSELTRLGDLIFERSLCTPRRCMGSTRGG